jgi:hypothetical protein
VTGSPEPATAERASYAVDTTAATGEIDRMVAVFGGVDRKGKWRVRSQTQAVAVFGGIELDLRDAVFESQVIEISGFWCFGGMELKVPAGVEVRDQTSGIFGGTEMKDLGEPQPGAPVIVIKGVSIFAGVSVKGPKPARSWGKAMRKSSHGCSSSHRR